MDGHRRPRANGLFRAELPAGSHTVVFAYRSPAIRGGLLVSLASMLGRAIIVGRRRSTRPS
jgi:hypothetical protein